MIPGLDISNHQGSVDWGRIAAAGYQFAFVKASEGVGFRDAWLNRNWELSQEAGLVRGAYHYARPDLSSPEAEADYFVGIMHAVGLGAGDLLALDIEAPQTPIDLGDWALAWLERVRDAVGFRPFLYSYPHFMGQHGLNNRADLTAYPLWYASYRQSIPPPPPGWPVYVIWQHAVEAAPDTGIDGNIDLNWFMGDDINELRQYGMVAPTQYVVGAGVEAAMSRHGDVAIGDEIYYGDGYSITPGRDAAYSYVQQSDTVYRQPKA